MVLKVWSFFTGCNCVERQSRKGAQKVSFVFIYASSLRTSRSLRLNFTSNAESFSLKKNRIFINPLNTSNEKNSLHANDPFSLQQRGKQLGSE
jgi:hypothetical protein